MTPLRQRMIEDMQLRGLSEATQQSYVGAVKQLAQYYGKSPEQLTEEELRHAKGVSLPQERQVHCHQHLHDESMRHPIPVSAYTQAGLAHA